MGDGPRATPTIAGDRVFVFTGEGVLATVNFQDGKLLWSVKPLSVHSGEEAEYGMACSPLVIGDLVVVTVGAPEATLVAYDIRSGKEHWKAGNDPAGYSSPAVLNVGGRSQIVSFTGDSAIGVDIQKGKILWRFPYETNYQCNIATPITVKDQVFLSAGENHGSVLLALKPSEDQFEVEPVWSSFGASSVMRNEWQTSLLLDGYLYGMDNVGGAGPITHLKCIQADTGKMAWQQLRFGKGNLIAADGKLWITTIKGELVIVRASPDRFEELARAPLLQSTRQTPALSQGRMYLRDDMEIVCIDVRKK
jgi:outer membrane protein assembly factor BamB